MVEPPQWEVNIIYGGSLLEPPHWGGSNKLPPFMFRPYYKFLPKKIASQRATKDSI